MFWSGMGRKLKFGEESAFVSVRVPKSRVLEYREAMKLCVNDKFAMEVSSDGDWALITVFVPKDRVGEYRDALKRFVEQKVADEGGFSLGSESGVKGFANLVEVGRELGEKVGEDDS